MKKSILTLTTILLTFAAQADADGPGAKTFHKNIDSYKTACETACTTPFREEVLDNAGLNKDLKTSLEKVSFEQAQIWADTILEGDYHSDGHTQLADVTAIFKNDKLIGYKIRYSEKAWYTGNCDFDPENEDSLAECDEGRIIEGSFVSADFKTYFRNDDDVAEFYEN